MLIGFALIFSPHTVFSAKLHWGVAPTWERVLPRDPIAMIAYTGIETVSEPRRGGTRPAARHPAFDQLGGRGRLRHLLHAAVVALSALPVTKGPDGYHTLLGLSPSKGGFQNDPVLGLVEHLGLHGQVLSAAKVYVGILAATILFIATNAGVIGASGITYAMASYRQLPEVFRRLHPRFKTPWLSLVVFAGLISIAVLLPGKTAFLGDMYAFGAMLSFTIAHLAVIALRVKSRDRLGGLQRSGRAFASAALTGRCSRSSAPSGPAQRGFVVVVQKPGPRWAGSRLARDRADRLRPLPTLRRAAGALTQTLRGSGDLSGRALRSSTARSSCG